MEKPTLAYWDIRGVAQPIRFLLEYLGVNYNERLYKIVDEGDSFNLKDWTDEKYNLGLDFPNLPYWIDNRRNIKLTESRAIGRHIGRTYGKSILGKNADEMRDSDLLENIIFEAWMKLVDISFSFNGDKAQIKKFEQEQLERMKKISEFLGFKEWLTGENINVVDFWLYEFLYGHKSYKENFIEGFPNFIKFMQNFENLPEIKDYINSPKYMKGPILEPMAKIKF